MELFYKALITSLFAVSLASEAPAQDRALEQAAPNTAITTPGNTPMSLTGKERLGKKWMDEQRIDNCNVPLEKRGSRPRAADCPHVPAG